MARKPYTPERAYRVSVRPLAVFFVVSGVALSLAVILFRDEAIFLPPFEGAAKRIVGALIGIFVGAIGLGLYFRRKIAWYAMLGYFILGTPWSTWAFATASEGMALPVAFVVAGPLLNVGIAIGLYFVTKPVFLRARGNGQTDETG